MCETQIVMNHECKIMTFNQKKKKSSSHTSNHQRNILEMQLYQKNLTKKRGLKVLINVNRIH